MIEALEKGEPLPFDLTGSAIYYVDVYKRQLVRSRYMKKLADGRRDLVVAALQRRGFAYSVIKEAVSYTHLWPSCCGSTPASLSL